MKRQQPDDEGKEKGTNWYLEQLNLLYEEKSVTTKKPSTMDEKERLVFMAKMLRLLQGEDEIEILVFFDKVLVEVDGAEEDVRDAVLELSTAGLVILEDGKIRLTDAGREVLSQA